MAKTAPYLASPGSAKKVLETIHKAPTPAKVNYDWVKAKVGLSGGTARSIPPLLKKIGFLASDGSPTDLYKQFRNSTTAGAAMAQALKKGYAVLYEHNEYLHDLPEKDLKGILAQATGMSEENRAFGLTVSTFKALKEFADFDQSTNGVSPPPAVEDIIQEPEHGPSLLSERQNGLGLSYNINLNLPATNDIAVYNAIFKALKEHLLHE